ncbi:MAG: DoxX family protein [Solirubrobacteraceae bacterium]
MKLGLMALRGVIGALFVGHGTQKLFGWFGGHGLEGTGKFFESIGLRPGKRHATAAGAAEAGGGALLALGLFTPAAAAALIGTMFTAIQKVHFKNGPWATDSGYEYNLALIAALIALADLGPGDLSLDRALGTEIKGPAVALAALAGGVAGAALMTRTAEEEAPEVPVPAPEPAGAVPVPAGRSEEVAVGV